MKTGLFTFIILFFIFALSGCATMMKGYESKVYITCDSNLIKVTDQNNQVLSFKPIHKRKYTRRINPQTNTTEYYYRILSTKYELNLRSGKEHWLNIETENRTKTVYLYPKLSFGWTCLDIITGILPGFIDAYTGSWTHFDNIDIQADTTKSIQ